MFSRVLGLPKGVPELNHDHFESRVAVGPGEIGLQIRACGPKVVEQVKKLKLDIFGKEVSIPELNSLDKIRQFHGEATNAKVLIFTLHLDEEITCGSLRAGARAYVVNQALQTIVQGGSRRARRPAVLHSAHGGQFLSRLSPVFAGRSARRGLRYPH